MLLRKSKEDCNVNIFCLMSQVSSHNPTEISCNEMQTNI